MHTFFVVALWVHGFFSLLIALNGLLSAAKSDEKQNGTPVILLTLYTVFLAFIVFGIVFVNQ